MKSDKSKKVQYNLILSEETTDTRLIKDRGKRFSQSSNGSWYYFGIVGQIGFSIAIPIAGGAILGSSVDRWWGTYPKWTLGLLFLGVLISFITFITTIRMVLKGKK